MTSTDYKHINGSGLSHLFGLLKGKYGEPQTPYTEVEWIESNGTQYVYLDWKPPIATWGFEADFIIKNAFGTTVGAWNQSTNVNGYGSVFGTRNASMTNDVQLTTYTAAGILRFGSAEYKTSGLFKTDKTRQQVSLRGTSLRRGDGTTVTVTRSSETANKPYANVTVFAMHEGVRRAGTGSLVQPGTVRIYSLKFYDGDTLAVNLVGAIRNRDGMTGLYDKVAGHFYPAANMTYGAVVGDLGAPDTVAQAVAKKNVEVFIDNRAITRMWSATVPELDKLEDGQQITVAFTTAVSGSTPTAAGLVGWDETSTTSYSNVYLKLTLADGTDTDWIPCYYSAGSRLTTQYGSGVPLQLTYRENVLYNATTTSAGTSVVRAWYAESCYNTDDVYTRYSDTVTAGLNGVKRYSLNMRDANGNWTSIMNQDNNTGATGKTAYTGGLQLGNIIYHDSSANIAAGGNTGRMKESQGGLDFRYDVNGVTNAAGTTELKLRKPVYLVGTVGSDSLFYLDQTKWWTQDSFTTGKVYIQIGTAYSSYYAIFLSVNNPAYTYDGSNLVPFAAGNCSGTSSNVTGTVAIANGGTGATSAANARTNLGVPPTSHASTGTTYGAASTTNYGHVKLSNATDSTAEDLAATPKAVKAAYDLADTAASTKSYGSYYNCANLTLTTSAQKIALADFSGSGTSASDNGIKVDKAGVYLVNGSAYLNTGFTANDLVHLIIVKNGTWVCNSIARVYMANMYQSMQASVIVTCAANDVLYLYAYNQTGARGSIADRDGHGLSAVRLA